MARDRAELGAGAGGCGVRLELGSWPSLEAQVAAIADDIAYDNHDIDDGLRPGLFTLEELLEVPLVRRGLGGGAGALSGRGRAPALPELIRHQIGAMVADLLARRAPAWRRRARRTPTTSAPPGRPLAGFLAGHGGERAGAEALPLRADVRRAAGAADPGCARRR
jgi:dGTPase